MNIKQSIRNSFLILGLYAVTTVTMLMTTSLPVNADETTSLPEITVYKTPSCGCCGNWVKHLESNGFTVNAINKDSVNSIKQELGIPTSLQSCHTAKVSNYVVEGHVPASDIKRMLMEKPEINGLAVPGMPMGSPGMEGSRVDEYDVIAIGKDNNLSVFSSH